MSQKRWRKYGRSWKQFSKENLAMPGTIVEVSPKKQHRLSRSTEPRRFLIGHINSLRGVCDDCVEFDADDVVHSYLVALSLDDIVRLTEMNTGGA